MLWRPHDRHRDLRGRTPTTALPDGASRRNQNRYLMSTSVASPFCTDKRVPRRSSTRHANPRPHRRPPLLRARHSSQGSNVMGAPAMPVGVSSRSDHSTAVPQRLDPTSIAAAKSPWRETAFRRPHSPRVPSLEAFGRRPPVPAQSSRWAVIRNPSQTRTCGRLPQWKTIRVIGDLKAHAVS